MPKDNFENNWLGINPGRLRHRVSIEEQSTSQDAAGQPLTTWSLVGQANASIEPLNGREVEASGFTFAEVDTKIMLRWISGVTSGLTPKNRITFGTKIYDIHAALNLEERNILLEVMAKQRIGSGINGQCE